MGITYLLLGGVAPNFIIISLKQPRTTNHSPVLVDLALWLPCTSTGNNDAHIMKIRHSTRQSPRQTSSRLWFQHEMDPAMNVVGLPQASRYDSHMPECCGKISGMVLPHAHEITIHTSPHIVAATLWRPCQERVNWSMLRKHTETSRTSKTSLRLDCTACWNEFCFLRVERGGSGKTHLKTASYPGLMMPKEDLRKHPKDEANKPAPLRTLGQT